MPTDRFDESFAEESRQVLRQTYNLSVELGHRHTGTEHLLLALLRSRHPVLSAVLSFYDLSAEALQSCAERYRASGTVCEAAPDGKGLTKPLLAVLETAVRLAKQDALTVSPVHLALGILATEDCLAMHVLRAVGAPVTLIRSQLNRLRTRSASRRQPPQEAATTPIGAPAGAQPERGSALEKYGTDLVAQAKRNEFDPLVGREAEIERLVQILARRTKNNPLLVGEPGIGKTAIVQGLAQRIARGEMPPKLQGKRIFAVTLGTLVAGTMYRGQFEERVQRLVDEMVRDPNCVVFIDEIHTLIGAGGAEGALDAANLLKPYLASGAVSCIGATTLDEYRQHISKDAALDRRFQPVYVEEPSVEQAVAILRGLRPLYEEHHGVRIADQALEAAAGLAARYIVDRRLPDKALDVLDEACARTQLFSEPSRRLAEVRRRYVEAMMARERSLIAGKLAEAEEHRAREVALGQEAEALEREASKPVVDREAIAGVVSMWTGIPLGDVGVDEREKLRTLEERLRRRVVGQDPAVQAVCRAVRRARFGVKDPKRPVGSFFFLGPTGVGKTELVKALAEALFGTEDSLVKVDMSEYQERHSLSRLIGAPPGYVGYEQAGQLTEAVYRRPYSVVLFDEVEKGHPDVLNVLLQLLEDGYITDGQGRRIDFRNTLIVMTSNLGTATLGRTLGFHSAGVAPVVARDHLLGELKRYLRPELLNRLDNVVVFDRLAPEHLAQIVDLQLDSLCSRLADQGLTIEVSPEARAWLAREGYTPEYGARPLRRLITEVVENELIDRLVTGEVAPGDAVAVDLDAGRPAVRRLVPVAERA